MHHIWAESVANSRAAIQINTKICKFRKVIFSSFYNISQPNFAILLAQFDQVRGEAEDWVKMRGLKSSPVRIGEFEMKSHTIT
jgi:hypothetical protein